MKPYYEDDACTIYHGNCLDVLQEIQAVDHVITDPPYSRDVYLRMRSPDSPGGSSPVRRLKKSSGIVKMAAGSIGSIDELCKPVSAHIARVCARWAIVFSDVEYCHEWRGQLIAAGLRYLRTGAWVKPDPMPQMTGDRPGVGFEPCTICHSTASAPDWNGGGKPGVWTYGTVKRDRPDHPCPKPLGLMQKLVEQFTNVGETVLDPFMGSGTTLRAAKDLGRKAIGIELEEKYCEAAAKRMSQEVFSFRVAQ